MSGKKTKKYFKYSDGKSKALLNSVAVVRWIEAESNKIKSDGPFKNLTDAENKCQDLLKSGVCAWLVRYNNG
jgi:hypothetical protein